MKWDDALMSAMGAIEIIARDYVALRRRVNEQGRALGAVVSSNVPCPRIRTRYHVFVRYDGAVVGCAVIRPRLRGGWSVRFGSALTKQTTGTV